MEKEEIRLIIDAQRNFFASGITLDTEYRLEILRKLRSLIILHEQDIVDALWKHFPTCNQYWLNLISWISG